MQQLIKYCARGALGLGTAALLLTGVSAQAGSSVGAPVPEPRLMAQAATQPESAQQAEKRRLEEQKKKLEQQQQQQQKQQQAQPRRMRTRGAAREATPEALPAPAGKSRFGAGVVRHGDPGDTEKVE
jgi:hypothetical protein